MPTLEELMRRALQEQIPPDNDELFHQLEQKKRGRYVRHRIGTVVLTVAVLVATAGGFIALTSMFRQDARQPASSGAGAIVITRVTSSTDDRPSLWLANPDGSDPRLLVALAASPSLSPDGRTLAFIWFGGPGPHPALATMPIAGGEPELLSPRSVAAGSPTWSPDGEGIAYVRVDPEHDSAWMVDADGSDDRPLRVGDFAFISSLSFSPDGSRLVFAASTSRSRGPLSWDLYVFDLASGQSSQLSRTPEVEEQDPAWSPDGSRIAFTAYEPGFSRSSVWTVSPSGADPQVVAEGWGREARGPAWSPDGLRMLISDGVWIYRVSFDPADPGDEPASVIEGLSAVWLPEIAGSSDEASDPIEQGGRDIGLDFRMCFVERLGGIDFTGDGTSGSAWIGVRPKDDATCVRSRFPEADRLVLAIDHTGDEFADSWVELPFECPVLCTPFDAADLDGNDTEELVVASHFSIMSYYLFSLRPDDDGKLQVEPILVADPGHPPAGITAGEPLRIDAGGDEGYESSIRCEGFPQDPVIVWAWRLGVVDSDASKEAHETRIELRSDGLFHVVGANDSTVPAGEPGQAHETVPACGVDWHPAA